MMHIHKPGAFLDDEARAKKARRIFKLTYNGVMASLVAAMILATLLPHNPFRDWYVLVAVWGTDLARWAATRACQRAGVSMESSQTETIRRDARAALAPFLGEAPALSVGCSKKPRTRIDREGIERRNWRGKPALVPWSQVEACTFTRGRHVTGEPETPRLVLWGRDGKSLLWMCVEEDQAAPILAAVRFYLQGEGIRDDPAST